MSTANFNTAVQTSKVLCKLVYKPQTKSVRLIATINQSISGKDLRQQIADYVGTDVSLRMGKDELSRKLVKEVKRACDEFGSRFVTVAVSTDTWNKLTAVIGDPGDNRTLLVWPYNGRTVCISNNDFKTRYIIE